MAQMVMPAGVDAARDADVQVADLLLQPDGAEMVGDLLGDGDGTRGGQRAVIHAGAGDDVAGQPGIRGGKARGAQLGV